MDRLSFLDLHRFMASLGVAMIALALALPWLFVRSSSDEGVTLEKYVSLTETGRRLVDRRQRLHEQSLIVLPWASTAVALSGALLLHRGIRRWGALQRLRDEGELRSLTGMEIAERVMAETEEEAVTSGADALGEEVGAVGDTDVLETLSRNSKILTSLHYRVNIESGVGKLLQATFGSANVRTQVAAGVNHIDAVVRLHGDRRLLVETKMVRGPTMVERVVRTGLVRLNRARDAWGRSAQLLVVVVVADVTEDLVKARLAEQQYPDDVHVVVVPESVVANQRTEVFASLLPSFGRDR